MGKHVNDFNETVRLYYDDLKKFKPMTKATEKKLLRRCKRGDLDAKNKVIEANLRFVFDVAKRYSGMGVPMAELISEGNLGLMKAIDKFDTSKDVKLISYAIWWIRQSIVAAIKKRAVIDSIERAETITARNSNDIEEGVYEDDDRNEAMSLDNVAEEVEKREENALQRELIDEMMKVLNDREKFVLGQNYGLNGAAEKTLVEIGKELGMSSERVRQIKLNAMRKIRTFSLIMEEDCEDFNLSDIY